MIEQASRKQLSNAIEVIQEQFYENLDYKVLELYVSPLGKEKNQFQAISFDLVERIVEKFILDDSKKSLLLLGDSGLGKSTLSIYLTHFLWEHQETFGIIPLFIHLPTIPEKYRAEQLLEHFLQNKRGLALRDEKANALYRSGRLLLILDGYDEISNPGNLFYSNRWHEIKGLRVITTCRPEALNKTYVTNFYSLHGRSDNFLQYVIQPFDIDQMEAYCYQYISSRFDEASDPNRPFFGEVDDYLKQINKIPGLKKLCQTPFVLSMVVEVLPSILEEMDQEQKTLQPLTRLQLYDHFTKQWFIRQATRLQEQYRFERLGFQATTEELAAYLRLYSENLASKVLKQGRLEVIIEDDPKYSVTLNMDLLYARQVSDIKTLPNLEKHRKQLQEAEDDAGMKWIRSGCLLKTQSDHTFSFLHKSLVEYFAANDLFKSVLSFECGEYLDLSQEEIQLNHEQYVRLRQFTLNSQLIIQEPGIVRILAERVQQDDGFRDFLMNLLEQSKAYQGHLIETASANAITILNWAGCELREQNLSGIRIPGANLSHSDLMDADLSYTNLNQVNFSQTNLTETKFIGASMENVEFGEHPYIEKSSRTLCCAYSDDGRYLAAGSEELGYVVIYDAENQVKLVSFIVWNSDLFGPSCSPIKSLIFSPKNENGKCEKLAVGTNDGIIKTYRTGKWTKIKTIKRYRRECSHPILSVAFDRLSKKIISGSEDGTIRIWDVESGKYLKVLEGHTGPVTSVVFDHIGEKIISGSEDGTIRIWDIDAGKCLKVLAKHTDTVTSIVYNHKNHTLVSGSIDKNIRVWDIETGDCLQTLEGHTSPIVDVSLDHSGQKIITTALSDKRIQVLAWDVETGHYLQIFMGDTEKIESVGLDCSRMRVALGCKDKIRVLDLGSVTYLRIAEGHTASIKSISYDYLGKRIISGSKDGTIRIWSIENGDCLKVLKGHTSSVNCLVFDHIGMKIISGSKDRTIRIWDIETGNCLQTLEEHEASVIKLFFDHLNKKIISTTDHRITRVWDLESNDYFQISHYNGFRTSNYGICNLVFDDLGKRIITTNFCDKEIRVWENLDGRWALLKILRGHTYFISAIAYDCLGKRIISGGAGSRSISSKIRIWDIEKGDCLKVLEGHTSSVNNLVFDHIGMKIISGSRDGTIRIWDIESGDCLQVLNEHADNMIVDSPNRRVISSQDKVLRGWDIETGSCLQTTQFLDFIVSITLSTEGNLLVAHGVNLSILSLNSDGLYQVLFHCPRNNQLHLEGCLIEGVSGLSEVNQKLLKQRGAIGKPQEYTKETNFHLPALYYPSTYKQLTFINSQIRPGGRINAERWSVALVRKVNENHAFLLIEGIHNDQRHFVRAELRVNREGSNSSKKSKNAGMDNNKVEIVLKALDDHYQLEISMQNYVYQPWCIDSDEGRILIHSINESRGFQIDYDLLGGQFIFFSSKKHNCLTWCIEKLNEINIYPTESWLPIPKWILKDQSHPSSQENFLDDPDNKPSSVI